MITLNMLNIAVRHLKPCGYAKSAGKFIHRKIWQESAAKTSNQ